MSENGVKVAQVAGDTSRYSIGMLAARTIQLVAPPIYLLFLTTEDFGIQGIALLNEQILRIVAGYAITSALARYYSEAQAADDADGMGRVAGTAVYAIVGLGLVVGVIWELFAEPLARLTLDGSTTSVVVIRLVGVSFIANMLFNVVLGVWNLHREVWKYSVWNIVQIAIWVVTSIILLWATNLGVVAVVLGWVVSSWVVGGYAMIWLASRYRLRFDWGTLKKLVAYGLPVLPAAFFLFVQNGNDRYLLKEIVGMTETGVYVLVLQLAKGFNFALIVPYMTAWTALMWKTHYGPQGGTEQEKQFHRRMLTYYFAAQAFPLVGVAVYADVLMFAISAGRPEFVAAAMAVPIIHLGSILNGTHSLFAAGYSFEAKMHYYTISVAVATVVSFAMNWILIPVMGLWGCAIGNTTAFFIFAGLSWIFGRKFFPVAFEWWRIARCVMAAMLAIAGGLAARTIGGIPGIALAVVPVMAYPLFLYVLRFFRPQDMVHLRSFRDGAMARVRGVLGRS